MTRGAVFVDLDSTLCDTRQRWHIIREGEERKLTDWVEYAMACSKDAPIPGTVKLVRLLHELGMRIVILSGRAEEARSLTVLWLAENGVPWDDMILRDDSVWHDVSNGEFKRRMVLQWLASHPTARAELVIDDWKGVRKSMDEIGLTTLMVSPAYDEPDAPMMEYARTTENAEADALAEEEVLKAIHRPDCEMMNGGLQCRCAERSAVP